MVDEATPTEPLHCAGTKRDGQPCEVRILVDGRHCLAHAPGMAERRAAGARRGGRNRSNAVRLRALAPPALVSVYARLEQALEDVLDGRLDPRTATAAAALARAMAMVLQVGELESRVRQLEQGGADARTGATG